MVERCDDPPGKGGSLPVGRAVSGDGQENGQEKSGSTRRAVDAPSLPRRVRSSPERSGSEVVGPVSDAELVSRARGGDDSAYEELYRRHCEAVRRYARGCCQDLHTAEDLTGEVFARTLQAIRGGSGPNVAMRPYLLTVVRRVAAAWGKTVKREQLVEDFAVFATTTAGSAAGSRRVDEADAASADVQAMGRAEHTLAVRAFRSLPERWQAVLWHTTVERESPSQIAPLLGLTANATAVLAHRAREGLRQAYLQAHVSDSLIAREECGGYADRLGAYARGGLRTRADQELRKHLDTCDRCRAAYVELADVNACLKAVLPTALIGWSAASYVSKVAATGAGSAGTALGMAVGTGARTSTGAVAEPGSTQTGAGAAGGGTDTASGASTAGAAPSPSGGAAGGPTQNVGTSLGPDSSTEASTTGGIGIPVKIAAGSAVAAIVLALALIIAEEGGNGGGRTHAKPSASAPVVMPPNPGAPKPAPGNREEAARPENPGGDRARRPGVSPPTTDPSEPGGQAGSEREPGYKGHPDPPERGPEPQFPPGGHPDDPEPPGHQRKAFPLRDVDWSLLGKGNEPVFRIGLSNRVHDRSRPSIGGVAFPNGGVSMASPASVLVDLNRGCDSFSAFVGVDDQAKGKSKVEFQVNGDGRRLFTSTPIRKGDRAVPVHVNLNGVSFLRLVAKRSGAPVLGRLVDLAHAEIRC